jgi:hypothetical protein
MNEAIAKAIVDIRASWTDATVTAEPDNDGGAYVIVEPLSIGDLYNHATTWLGFRITFQYPYADVYPHFVRPDLQRKDGRALGDGMSDGHSFAGRTAIQISRRSNRLDPATDTAALKLGKVLQWLATRP